MLRTHRRPLTLLALLVASLLGLVTPVAPASADTGEHIASLSSSAGALAVGYDHGCYLRDGLVYCWGYNSYGQSGQALSVGGVSWPTVIPNFSGVTSISSGNGFSCAVKTDGTVWCWGNGQYLATGQGAGVNNVPTQVGGVTSAVAVSAGYYHACALRSNGTIYCWGQGDDGQIGDGANADNQSGVAVSGITTAVAVAAGENFTCAALADGSAQCWGGNMMGQIGNGGFSRALTPETVQLAAGGNLSGAVGITAGNDHACAVTSSKTAFCWGADYNGMLGSAAGTGSSTTRAVQVRASLNSGSFANDVVAISAGDGHTCILREAGTVSCFGNNMYGQIGNGILSGVANLGPVAATGVTGMLAVGTGRNTSCALNATEIKCWGEGNNGQRADGTNVEKSGPVGAYPFVDQSVTFGSLTDAAISSGTRTISATSSSGAAVTFTSTTTSVCTVSGTTVTYVAPGTCTVRASRAASGIFLAAADVDRSFSISGNKPTTRTAAATSVSASRATLNAVVNPSGLATTVKFVYGLKADLSDGTEQASRVDTSMSDSDISGTVTGLAERTTYYFRVEATNEQGTSKGDIMSFTTARPVGVTVNDAAEFTNKRGVTVSVTGPTGSAQAILSNDGGFSNSKTFTLTDAAADIPWTLVASKDERLPKVVYVKFVSRLGSASTPYQDDIILDTTAPTMTGATGASSAPASGAVTVAAARGGVRLVVRASDKNSGIGKVQVKSSASGRISDVATGSPKATSRTVRVNTTKKRLWVRVVDRAGNASRWVTVTVK